MTSFSILAVGTRNVCRSPLIEQMLREKLTSLHSVCVASAGTSTSPGEAMEEQAAAFSWMMGWDPSAQIARQLTERELVRADLVLAVSREQRHTVVGLAPQVVRRTYTIREFARLLEHAAESDLHEAAGHRLDDAAGRLATLVKLAASRRGVEPLPLQLDADDVLDPQHRGHAAHRKSFDQIVSAVDAITATFRTAASVTRT